MTSSVSLCFSYASICMCWIVLASLLAGARVRICREGLVIVRGCLGLQVIGRDCLGVRVVGRGDLGVQVVGKQTGVLKYL